MRRCALIFLVMVSGCARGASPAATSTAVPTASACTAPHLAPSYIPDGMHPVKAERVADWTDAWSADDRRITVIGNISADFGDDPSVKEATVRHHPATYGFTSAEKDETAIQWREPTRCGELAYGVIVRGIEPDEMIRIADSLR